MARGVFSSAEEVARALVADRVAPAAAAGWARRRADGGWDSDVGGASADDRATASSFFDLASLTKPMTALALARAALDRRRALGDALPEVAASPSAELPLELLLAHRAGLEAHLDLWRPLLGGAEVRRPDALREAASARRPDAEGRPPDEGFAPLYSDLGYLLVGEALARFEHARDAGEVLEVRVARALGLEDELGTARALAGRRVEFERRVEPTEVAGWRGGEIRGAVHDENAWALTGLGGSGHAGMFGTASAVLAFGRAALDAIEHARGPLALTDASWLVRPRPGGTLRAGFDGKSEAGSSAGELAGPRTFGHLGFTGTSLWIDPDAGAVAVLLTNRVHPTRENVAIRAARPWAHDALFRLAAGARSPGRSAGSR